MPAVGGIATDVPRTSRRRGRAACARSAHRERDVDELEHAELEILLQGAYRADVEDVEELRDRPGWLLLLGRDGRIEAVDGGAPGSWRPAGPPRCAPCSMAPRRAHDVLVGGPRRKG
jgi:hypothetical protein